ncbi:putative glutamine-dependent NAD(+) synthetase-like isoform X2 [Dinothrombium tinctorium]|uniref:Glutamine-dependent NAD(+) synthetase n=1 Tax=Dinothrombium tinctorium TaxID=1965070 RepID=A0A443QGI2_9ACAR|nr:putative glutamine-dependent NAD(+) synthetase-like isoform X2 [Dinothrombium tinctorium]
MEKFGIAVCTLNQFSLDFQSNCERIKSSIRDAIKYGAIIRVGPELEITGYGCEDAFFEVDTVLHAWQVVAEIIKCDFKHIIIDLGMPVLKDSSLYNCRILLLNSKILFIRPKMRLANDGNYRESRWFTPWGNSNNFERNVVWFQLPALITSLTGQQFVPFGSDVVLDLVFNEKNEFLNLTPFRIGFEVCEEMWNPESAHIKLFYEKGCHLVCNSSASYWELRKLNRCLKITQTTTSKSGGVYAYSNSIGCDGGRICFAGRSVILLNGEPITMTMSKDNFLNEVQVAVAYINQSDVTSYRQQSNIKVQSHRATASTLLFDSIAGFKNVNDLKSMNDVIINIKGLEINKKGFELQKSNLSMINTRAEEEILIYVSLWLWDYLRRSSMKGFIVPLSGGIDSCSVAILVYCLCTFLEQQISNLSICKAVEHICGQTQIKNATDICKHMLRCCYLATKYSGKDSLERAKNLTRLIGADFREINFNNVYEEIQTLATISKKGLDKVTLSQQNLQARLRMVLTYYLSEGDRLVLATGNVDEALVGYLTKYDCSSADLNPIGSISKHDLREFVHYFKTQFVEEKHKRFIDDILNAVPSAELTGEEQRDEDDIGITYDELSIFGRVRRGDLGCYGPYGMFCKLWEDISNNLLRSSLPNITSPDILAFKVKRFFTLHSRNRHKQTVLTPALHSETYSPDDNRFDHRQFLFNSQWTWQFGQIDEEVEKIKANQ